MNHHLRRPLFLKHCLVFSEANEQRHLEWFTRESMHQFSRVVAVVPGSELAVGPQIVCACGTVDWKLALTLHGDDGGDDGGEGGTKGGVGGEAVVEEAVWAAACCSSAAEVAAAAGGGGLGCGAGVG
jgi:hypothetical protein